MLRRAIQCALGDLGSSRLHIQAATRCFATDTEVNGVPVKVRVVQQPLVTSCETSMQKLLPPEDCVGHPGALAFTSKAIHVRHIVREWF